jgi:hypothetical protein
MGKRRYGHHSSVTDLPRPELFARYAALVSQLAALFGLASLAASIFYNVILFSFFDSEMLTVMTISDHIAMAILILPWVIFSAVVMMLRAGRYGAVSTKGAVINIATFAGSGILIYLLAVLLGHHRQSALALALGIGFGWAYGGDYFLRNWLRAMPKEVVTLARWIALVFITLGAFAVMEGIWVQYSKPNHRISLSGHGTIDGYLLLMGERGVIVFDPLQKVPLFIPRDQIRRVEPIR